MKGTECYTFAKRAVCSLLFLFGAIILLSEPTEGDSLYDSPTRLVVWKSLAVLALFIGWGIMKGRR